MLAGALFEYWSLAATRIVGLCGVIYSITVLVRMWRAQPAKGLRQVPRPVLMFTLGWLTILSLIFSSLLIGDNAAVTSGFYRAIYGMSLVWAIVGLTWIISIGTKAYTQVEAVAKKKVFAETVLQELTKDNSDR